MFEIHDERLGKLKIFNVTEARANFADVLREGHAKVVVTRHGRPTKILLSYEEYLSLLGAQGASLVTGPEGASTAASITGESQEKAAVPPKWVQRDAEQIVSSLKGLFNK
jgi:prevent-host-death family protein